MSERKTAAVHGAVCGELSPVQCGAIIRTSMEISHFDGMVARLSALAHLLSLYGMSDDVCM